MVTGNLTNKDNTTTEADQGLKQCKLLKYGENEDALLIKLTTACNSLVRGHDNMGDNSVWLVKERETDSDKQMRTDCKCLVRCHDIKGDNSAIYLRSELPTEWIMVLRRFQKKHPGPRKRHLKILVKETPHGVGEYIKSEAATLAERYTQKQLY